MKISCGFPFAVFVKFKNTYTHRQTPGAKNRRCNKRLDYYTLTTGARIIVYSSQHMTQGGPSIPVVI